MLFHTWLWIQNLAGQLAAGMGAESSRVIDEATLSVSGGQHGRHVHGSGDRKQSMSTFRGYYGGLFMNRRVLCGSLRQHVNTICFDSTPLARACSASVRARPGREMLVFISV